ncbi:MAG: hypothetical protein M0002_08135 [Rhodospirillales bacterium]|nr:hypothetical protein [Rhodospirillales bacterium]
MSLTVDGGTLDRWTSASVTRDLKDISGGFELVYLDSGRAAQAVSPDLDTGVPFEIVRAGMSCAVALDGERVLTGWIDEVDVSWNADTLAAKVSGRDKTGDLADCAASPNGPCEWANLDALAIANAIAQPFGIPVRAEVPVGAPFPVFGINVEETALIAIEKAARQRALLVVSDGVGGLVLTQGGSTRAPAALRRPGNVQGGGYRSSWRQRYSDYFVKGQTSKRQQRALTTCTITSAIDPLINPVLPPAQQASVAETVTVAMTGHAIDPEITRWRPNVRGSRTQSGTASAQAQAEWALRVAKGMGENLDYTVLDWRAGAANALWLPNQLVNVSDAWADVGRDMLIAGVTYRMSAQGITTSLRLAGRTAFARIDEPAKGPRYIFHRQPKSFGPTRTG